MIDSAFAPIKSGVGSDYAVGQKKEVLVAPPANPSLPTNTDRADVVSNSKQIKPIKRHAKKKKLLGIVVVALLIVGGLGLALQISQQQQEIRQQASQPEDPMRQPFSLTETNVSAGADGNTHRFIPTEGNIVSEVFGKFSFVDSPSCDSNFSCAAPVTFEITAINSDSELICTTNTASLVSYTFLTNTNDPNYPSNLTANSPTSNANCNRPLTDCDQDSQCNQSDILTLYGSQTCGDECRTYEGVASFAVSETEYSCGCVQFDPNISTISLNCKNPDDSEFQTLTFSRDIEYNQDQGPWAYGSNVTCPVSDVPSATPTPTTEPIGEMCLSISSTPARPKFNDSVSFTCGLVLGISNYEFRYFEPNSVLPISIDIASTNISKPIRITKTGRYTAQCRICPIPTENNRYCEDPNWGWDPVVDSVGQRDN